MDDAKEEVVQFCHQKKWGFHPHESPWEDNDGSKSSGGVLLVKNCQGYGEDTGLTPIDDPRFHTILQG
ncbi:hypothetical protein DUI87_19775 [Hirundo rustica rustica]|uniref:Uncharacterized protein n=1 Tax=Hirundo rustica rustica TaxID=333673 RepID=A0A3M0JXN2_HIRRU|nr:hypothetical protein DUI87_19775 [Hirundo rustica rustica]